MSKPTTFQVQIAFKNLRHKSPGIDQIPAEMINRGRTCHSQIYELVNSTWNMEELPEQWKESITVPIYKKGDEIDCTNYRGVSHLSPKIQNSSQCPSDKLTPYGEEITGGHQCRF